MEVARHGAQDDLAAADGAAGSQSGLQSGHASLHGFGGDEHLGNENLAVAEGLAHAAHGVNHALVEDYVGVDTLVQSLLDKTGDNLSLALLHVQGQFLQNRHFDVPPIY